LEGKTGENDPMLKRRGRITNSKKKYNTNKNPRGWGWGGLRGMGRVPCGKKKKKRRKKLNYAEKRNRFVTM